MNKEFATYEQSLALKELGFDEPCFAIDNGDNKLFYSEFKSTHVYYKNNGLILKQQVFRWFREKHGLYTYVTTHDSTDFEWYIYDKDQNDWEDDTMQNTYEEAESACIDKLIELAKKSQ